MKMGVKEQLKKDLKTLNSNPEKLTLSGEGDSTGKFTSSLKFTDSQTRAKYIPSENTIFLMNNGTLENLRVARKILVHEVLHSRGWGHCRVSRIYGFHSRLTKDELSSEMMERFGWTAPTEREIKEAFQTKTESANYRIYCECGYQTFRNRKSKIVKNPSGYICPDCGEANLESEEVK